jgi:Flp pilus assembly secretin CpaC
MLADLAQGRPKDSRLFAIPSSIPGVIALEAPNRERSMGRLTPKCSHQSKFALRLALNVCLASAILLTASGLAQAKDLIVRYDQSQLLRLPRAISQIIIGNPSIADASVQASNLLVVTGKTFGVTNIIALDKQGNVIQDQRVIVQRDNARMVNLHKGSQRQSFTCAPECTPTVTIGDDTEYFAMIAGHAQKKTSFSAGQSEGDDTGGGGGQ